MEVTVIGAGLSGLATAWHLVKRGACVRVVEAGPRPGGLISTVQAPEGLIETAARAFPWTRDAEAFFQDLAVPPLFARDESRRRYIFRDGRPKRWPLTVSETAGAAARFGRAWLSRRVRPTERETVAAWGERVLGRPATAWLIAPAVQGIYASPPSDLSAAALFGRDRPRSGKLAAPAGGMGELIDRLHEALRERGVTFEFNRPMRAEDIHEATPAVICTNAPAAARLLAPHAPALAAAIERIRMVSVVVVTAFFQPDPGDLRGFGVLFPRSAGVGALGVLFNAEIFAGRSDLRSETWIYGDLDAAALPATDEAARAAVGRDHAVLTGRSEAPTAAYVTRRLRALPLYDAAVLEARTALSSLPAHLAIAGNYLGRLGVSSLLIGAAAAAARLTACANEPRQASPSERSRARDIPAYDGAGDAGEGEAAATGTASRRPTPVCLCDLEVGAVARFHEARLDSDMRDRLHTLGLTPLSRIRLCKAGEPYIVQVRATRIGLSQAVAGSIFVIPETASVG